MSREVFAWLEQHGLTDRLGRTAPTGVRVHLMQAKGTLVKAGRRIALSEARLTDGDGRLYAHATSSCMILNG